MRHRWPCSGTTCGERASAVTPTVLGRTVQLGSEYATVVGVMREGFAFPVVARAVDAAADRHPGPGAAFGSRHHGLRRARTRRDPRDGAGGADDARAACRHRAACHARTSAAACGALREAVLGSVGRGRSASCSRSTSSRSCCSCSSAATSPCSCSRAPRRARASSSCARALGRESRPDRRADVRRGARARRRGGGRRSRGRPFRAAQLGAELSRGEPGPAPLLVRPPPVARDGAVRRRAHRARLRDRRGDACAQGDARHGIPPEAGRGRRRRTAVRRRLDRGDRRAGRDHGGISRDRLRRAVGVAPHPDVRRRIRRRGVSGRADRDGCSDRPRSERRFGPRSRNALRSRQPSRSCAGASPRSQGWPASPSWTGFRARPSASPTSSFPDDSTVTASVGPRRERGSHDRRSARRLSRRIEPSYFDVLETPILAGSRLQCRRSRARCERRDRRSGLRGAGAAGAESHRPAGAIRRRMRTMRPPRAPIPGSRSSAS